MSNIYDLADTWNAAGTTFTAIKMNVTDTASQAASLLMDLQIGGTSRVAIAKSGNITIGGSWNDFQFRVPAGGGSRVFSILDGATACFATGAGGLIQTGYIAIGASVGAPDAVLERDAANVLAQRRTTNAQTFRNYGTYTDSSNYRRVSLAMTTAGVATLLPEGAGTGASGNVLHISGLPTSNPGAGILWNNAGTPAIGT